jgi:hypothetical protein
MVRSIMLLLWGLVTAHGTDLVRGEDAYRCEDVVVERGTTRWALDDGYLCTVELGGEPVGVVWVDESGTL